MRSIEKIFDRIRGNWQFLLQGSAWIMTLLSGFVLPPPVWDFEQHLVWYRFAHFIVAALVGLMFVPLSRWAAKEHTLQWLICTILILIAGIVVFFQYQTLKDDWTVEYAGKPIIIGSTYSPDAENYKARIRKNENREVADKDLVMAAAGKTENLWDVKEIRQRGRILAAVYLLSIALFSISIITLIQVLYCNFQPTGKGKRRKTPAQSIQNRSAEQQQATPPQGE